MILLVAATKAELCGHGGFVCGVGPVEAAATTARALAETPARAVAHVGLAGGIGLDLGTVVVGTEAVYADISAAILVVSRVEPDPSLLATARDVLPEAPALPIATSAAVTDAAPSGHAAHVEAMEGFAVLRAAQLAGVPALELRAISNELGERERARWEPERALQALEGALSRLLPALDQ